MARGGRAKSGARRSLANEVLAVVLVALAILVFLSLASYNSADSSFNSVGPERPISNLIGHVGAYLSDGLLQVFGLGSLALPIVLVVIAYRAFFGEGPAVPAAKLIGSGLLLVAISGLLSLFPQWGIGLLKNSRNGGVVGYLVEGGLASFMNTAGAAIVLVAASILTVVLTMEVSLASMSGFAGSVANSIVQRIAANRQADKAAAKARAERSPRREFQLVSRVTNWFANWQDKRALAKQRAASEDETTRRVRLKIQRELEAKQEALRVPEDSPADMLDAEFKVDAFDPDADAGEPAPKPVVTKREAAKAQVRVEERAPAGVQAKQDAQEAMKAHRARNTPTESEITMDPEVAEMVSTASIVRTVQNSGSGSAASGPAAPAEKSERRSFAPKQADLASYKLPDLGLLEAPIGHHEQAEDELRERATVLAEKCKDFSVTGHIHRINPG
ncbi:MAG: DNA translocase FtsK 4TM domain-containing protein, partial [Blastocatellia bacterium]